MPGTPQINSSELGDPGQPVNRLERSAMMRSVALSSLINSMPCYLSTVRTTPATVRLSGKPGKSKLDFQSLADR
jgi:hypothetical protein